MLHWTRTVTLHGSTETVDPQKHKEKEQCVLLENSQVAIKSLKLVHEKKEGNVLVVFQLVLVREGSSCPNLMDSVVSYRKFPFIFPSARFQMTKSKVIIKTE